MTDINFIPYRCEDCVYGEYLADDSCWDCSIGVSSDKECEQHYSDDVRM